LCAFSADHFKSFNSQCSTKLQSVSRIWASYFCLWWFSFGLEPIYISLIYDHVSTYALKYEYSIIILKNVIYYYSLLFIYQCVSTFFVSRHSYWVIKVFDGTLRPDQKLQSNAINRDTPVSEFRTPHLKTRTHIARVCI